MCSLASIATHYRTDLTLTLSRETLDGIENIRSDVFILTRLTPSPLPLLMREIGDILRETSPETRPILYNVMIPIILVCAHLRVEAGVFFEGGGVTVEFAITRLGLVDRPTPLFKVVMETLASVSILVRRSFRRGRNAYSKKPRPSPLFSRLLVSRQ